MVGIGLAETPQSKDISVKVLIFYRKSNTDIFFTKIHCLEQWMDVALNLLETCMYARIFFSNWEFESIESSSDMFLNLVEYECWFWVGTLISLIVKEEGRKEEGVQKL